MDKKVGVILYHKDIDKIYKINWVHKCLLSIDNQSFKKFIVHELCYSNENKPLKYTLYRDYNFITEYYHVPMATHAHAMNYLLNKLFKDLNYDYVFNVNLDDYYHTDRFLIQLHYAEQFNLDLVNADMQYITEVSEGKDDLYHPQPIILSQHNVSMKDDLLHEWNVIAHPVVLFTKNFWLKNGSYNPKDIPKEDLRLWQKAIKNGANIFTVPCTLLYYRIHQNNTCRST